MTEPEYLTHVSICQESASAIARSLVQAAIVGTRGERIKQALELHGRSQRWLEKKVEVSPGYLTRLIKDERGKGVGSELIAKIARALVVREEWIRDGTEPRDLLDPASQFLDPSDPYPARARAIAAARLLGLSESAIADIRARPGSKSEDEAPATWWFKTIEAEQEAPRRRRPGTPIGPGSAPPFKKRTP